MIGGWIGRRLSLPRSMRAVLCDQKTPLGRGKDPAPITVSHEVPLPAARAGHALVRVRAASVNRADVIQRRGLYPPPPGAPDILGLDFSGDVVARCFDSAQGWATETLERGSETSGSGTEVALGDRVFGIVPGGGYAEYVAIPEPCAVQVPETLSHTEAAGAAEAFMTAYQALSGMIDGVKPFREGHSILVHAATGGVGNALTSLASAFGARHVIATGRDAEKLQSCAEQGATSLVAVPSQVVEDASGRGTRFREEVLDITGGRGVDLVVDFIGAPYLEENIACTARGGSLLFLALMGGARTTEGANLGLLMTKGITITGSTLRPRDEAYRACLAEGFRRDVVPLLASRTVSAHVSRVLPWDQAESAHADMAASRHLGKIVLEVE